MLGARHLADGPLDAEATRPRAAGVALLIAVMFYTSFTSAAFVALLTVLVIVMRPRLFFRWVGIGIGVLPLTLPIMPQFYEYGPGGSAA